MAYRDKRTGSWVADWTPPGGVRHRQHARTEWDARQIERAWRELYALYAPLKRQDGRRGGPEAPARPSGPDTHD